MQIVATALPLHDLKKRAADIPPLFTPTLTVPIHHQTPPNRGPSEGALGERSEHNPDCVVPGAFKHPIAARRRAAPASATNRFC